jgi:hypothetical protein
MNTNEAATSIALSKLDAAPNARALLTPGQYAVDTTINVSGYIRVGEDTTYTPTVCIPMLETLALFMHFSGVTRDSAAAKLVQAMQQSLALDGTNTGAISANVPIIQTAMQAVQNQIIGQLPPQPRKGTVTKRLTVRQLQAV